MRLEGPAKSMQTAADLPRKLCSLARNWSLVCAALSPTIVFWTFSRLGLQSFAPQCTTYAKKIWLCSEAMLCCYFLYLHSIVRLLVPPRSYFCAIIRHTESYPSAQLNSSWGYSRFERLPLHLPSAVHSGGSRNKDDPLSANVFLTSLFTRASHLVGWDLLVQHVFVGVVFSRRKLQTSRWWSVDSSEPVLTWTSKIDWNNLPAEDLPVSPHQSVETADSRMTVKEFPPTVWFYSIRTTVLSRGDANNIQGMSFDFLAQFVFFACEWGEIPVSDYQFMTRLPFTLDF